MREEGGSSGETRRLEEKTGKEVGAVVGDVCGGVRRRRWRGWGLPAEEEDGEGEGEGREGGGGEYFNINGGAHVSKIIKVSSQGTLP